MNYAAHAIESLQTLRKQIGGGLDLSRKLDWTVERLRDGVKFRLPDNGETLGESFDVPLWLSFGRLPYPVTVVEFRVAAGTFPLFENAPHFAAKRLAVAIDTASPEGRRHLDRFDHAWGARLDHGFGSDGEPAAGIVVLSIDCVEGAGVLPESEVRKTPWFPGWAALFLPYDQTEAGDVIRVDAEQGEILEPGRGLRHGRMLIDVCPFGELGTVAMENKDMTRILSDATEFSIEVSAVASLCAALACSNVRSHTEAPPIKLQKARLRRGQEPLYEYRTLEIEPSRIGAPREPDGPGDGRRSPRQHLRRGHIRRLENRLVWVSSAVIGAARQGVIEKDYAVHAAAGAHPPAMG